MKNLKRALAVLVVVTMMISTVAFASFSDVTDGTNVANAVNVGVGLNLFKGYEDGTFKPEGDITRAEFAAIVVRALGQEAQASGAATATSFTDVKADHWAAGYINIVTRLGVVNGYGDGTFGPEDKVTYEQAIKMIVVSLGYTPAIGSAGYPVGYLTKAGELGITSGVAGSNGVPANRGTVAQLIFNALDVPLMSQDGYGTDISFIINDGYGDTTRKTLMSENLDVVKLQVTVDSFDAVTSSTKNDNDVQVTILNNYKTKYSDVFEKDDTMPLDAGTSTIGDLVGSKAFAYVAYDDNSSDTPVVVFAVKDATKTEEVTVKSVDLDSVSVPNANNVVTVEYWANETDRNTTDISYDLDTVTYYQNGVLDTTPLNLTDVYGSVTFAKLKDGTTEDCDTVFITNYENFIVDSVSERNFKVSSKNAGSISFDPDDSAIKSTLYDSKGVEIKWTDLKEWDVVSAKIIDKDDAGVDGSKTVTVGTLVTDKVTGKVTEKDDSDLDNIEYTIDGKVYGTDPLYTETIKLDTEGTFYLDIMGNICEVDKTLDVSSNYAYIFDVEAGSGIDPKTEVKLFTKEGEFVSLKTAAKVKLDGVSNIATDTLLSGANKLAKGQFITYDVNSTNEISKIDRPIAGTVGTEEFSKYDSLTGTSTYSEDSQTLSTSKLKVTVTDKTVIMVAPWALTDPTKVFNATTNPYIVGTPSADEDDYELVNVASIGDDQTFTTVSFYNVNDDREVGAVVVNIPVKVESSTTGIAAITGKSTGTNTDGEEIDKIKVLQSGAVANLNGEANFGIDAEVGTAIIPVLNTKGEIKEITVLAVPNTDDNNVDFSGVPGVTSKVVYTYGEVTDRSRMTLTIDDGTVAGSLIVVPAAANVYVYDERLSTSNRTAVGSVTDFDAELNAAGTSTTYDNDVDTVYAIAREYDGKIVDVMIYIFEKDVN